MANDNPIEELTLEINATSDSAEKAVDKLIGTLERLHNKTANLGLGNIGTQLKGIQKAASGFGEKESAGLERILSALEKLQNVSTIRISSSIANQLTNIGKTAKELNEVDFSGVRELASALQGLSAVGEVNISSALTQLNRIPKIAKELKEIDLEDFAKRIREITEALKPLAEEMEKVSKGFSAFPDKLQKLVKETDNVTAANKRASDSFAKLAAKVTAAVLAIKKVLSVVMEWIDLANDQVETQNLFNVALGQYAAEATEYAEAVSAVMGLSPTEWMENQGVLMSLATGFGVAGDSAAAMSQNLTQLAYDLASFYNISTEDAFQKIQSGLAGEIEPMRRLGYDLSNAALQQIALSKGIDKTVSSMTQAEKAQLRYYAMMTQVTQVHGDLARTIDSPANQLRRLKTAVTEAARALGNLFIPLLNTVIPMLINAANAVKNFAETLMMLLGIENSISDTVEFTSVVTGAEDSTAALEEATEAAAEFRKMLLGIDELNVLSEKITIPSTTTSDTSLDLESALGDISNIWDGVNTEGLEGLGLDSPLAYTINDVFFEWENLTGEQIAQKLIVGFGALLGAVAGFSLLGLKGGLLGIAIGTALSLLLASAIFDHDGKLSSEELVQTLIPILAGITGWVVAGPVGGLVGFTIGAGLSLLLEYVIFDNDGKLSKEEIFLSLIPILSGIVGWVITANPVGGLIGLGIGTIVSLLIKQFGVDSENGEFREEAWNGVKDIIARAFAGAGIGFILTGNPAGALIGAAVGVMLSLALHQLGWNSDNFQATDLINSLLPILLAAGGAVIGFAVGGPAGAALGAAIGVGLSFLVTGINWDSFSEKVSGVADWISEKFGGTAKDVVDSFAQAETEVEDSFIQVLKDGFSILFDWFGDGFNNNADNIVKSFSGAKADVDLSYMEPTKDGFTNLFTWLKSKFEKNADQIVASFSGAKADVDLSYMKPTQQDFSNLFTYLKQNFASARENIAESFENAASSVMTNFISPLGTQAKLLATNITSWFNTTRNNIINAFKSAADKVVEIFRSFADWFNRNIITPINEKLGAISSKISRVTGGTNLTTPSVSVNTYATGGLPSVGELMIVRENGPELVGRIGNQSAVANNSQIIAGIKQGVYEAMMASNGGERNVNVYLSGKQVMTTVAEEAKRETIRTGINPLTQGG